MKIRAHSLQTSRRWRDQQGSILIQVGVGLVVLMATLMFVADYGLMWVARRQAQNAADAGALAGAIAIAFDADDRTPTGPAKTAAYHVALTNGIVGQQPNVTDPATSAIDIKFYSDDPTAFPATCADNSCVKVDVYRNQARNNPIPAIFGALVGVTNSGVRATATAQSAVADATDCLKPWAVVDKWAEHWPVDPGTWDDTSTYDKYYTSGGNKGQVNPAITHPDVYIPPTLNDVGTGFHPYNPDGSYTSDYGRQLTLKAGNNNDFDYGSGWFMALDLADSSGGKDYKNNIMGCIGVTWKIGDSLPVQSNPGNMVGPTGQAVGGPNAHGNVDPHAIYNQDPTAYWDPTMNNGLGGVAGSAYPVSPRIVAVPLASPDDIASANNANSNGANVTIRITNIMGFFVEGLAPDGKSVVGRLVTIPGLKTSGTPAIDPEAAFMHQITLVR
jgi:Flp pilus assembly protein TadG